MRKNIYHAVHKHLIQNEYQYTDVFIFYSPQLSKIFYEKIETIRELASNSPLGYLWEKGKMRTIGKLIDKTRLNSIDIPDSALRQNLLYYMKKYPTREKEIGEKGVEIVCHYFKTKGKHTEIIYDAELQTGGIDIIMDFGIGVEVKTDRVTAITGKCYFEEFRSPRKSEIKEGI